MSYQVLARKWRPRSFREMVGQTHVLKALINALDNQRLHHAYLFTGTRGVGKTTIARIIAKCLNCETGVSSTPCGQCSVCREIDEGRFVDLIEVDAASRTKVEDTRELLDNVQYAPSRGRYKVYLIDEVHMLSSHSFNALLKTLEEPPPHVKFLLATTDPQKLPVTILSRCLQFSLKNMPPERVVEHLTHVLGVENVPFEEDALWLLGRAADGSMRDAMSLTDQAIAFGEGKVLAADVRAMLGTLDHGQVYGVLQALLEGDARALLEAVRHLAEQGPDWAGVLAEMLNVLHRVAIAQALPDAVDNGQGDRDRVLALAQALPAEDVQFYYQMGLIGRRDLPLAPDPRSGFEMVLLRMLAFRPADTDDAPRTSLKNLGISPATADSKPAAVADTAAPGVSPVPSSAPEAPVASEMPMSAAVVAASPVEPLAAAAPEQPTAAEPPAPSAIEEQPVPVVDVPWNEPPEVAPVAVESDAVLPEPALSGPPDHVAAVVQVEEPDDDEPPLTDEDYFEVENQAEAYLEELQQDETEQQEGEALPAVEPATGLAAEWLELYLKLGLSGLTGSIAANCTLISVEGDRWLMHLDPAQSALFNPTQQRRLNDALNQYHGRTLQLDIVLQKPEQETPAQAAQRRRAERQRAAEQSIHADPLVQQLMQQFAAVIREGTIEPVEHSEP
ncbi:DNA polymerase III subunit gamma/tau [Stutzerimonas frequens]|uniref:DNA polymerase III subunit gamma/tau n=1 Tax=Stutzerimonas frequens TaxID=2968969 RepID=UPI00190C816E|nr:DNA polymerase III subunit gamma/tau [Stutzerimonas frequens]MBK3871956.1 DNA polymerase III subunit gamma/tau [Stutzerimonas frequens]MBK3910291.1 DNA polymerase III subunit gamma/tau [Stutzerimonas frequens]MBK3928140.1 DNA polymerase III subunit gamma/tau [Stutzerimonas frequens]